jgi:hypothetical protein
MELLRRNPRRATRTAILGMAVSLAAATCAAEVVFEPVLPSPHWPDAVEPGALRFACARDEPELVGLFDREGLPLRPELVRRSDGRVCHVFYRPSAPGFRTAPDDDPVAGLLFDTDALLYLAAGSRNRGEPVGAMREILRRIERPLAVDILIHRVHGEAAYERATLRSFGSTPHRVTLVERGVDRTFWWVQDYVKAGSTRRGRTLLVPRRVFEGSAKTGEDFEPLLARFAEREGAVRSRLSWEGGDLQFARDPRDPGRLLLFYGSFAKAYWGEALAQREFEYVLALEFGADRAIDLGGLAPHVDYFVSLVPRAGLALVGVPVSGDLAVARGAVDALLARFAGPKPGTLLELRDELSLPGAESARALQTLERARRLQAEWQLGVDPSLPGRMRSLVARACPGGGDCLSVPNQLRLLEADPATFEDWVHATQAARFEARVTAAHLDLVESQLVPVPEPVRRLVLEKIAELEALGFRVVRVPSFRVDLVAPRGWPGISYVNALVVDQQVFVPRFGLGDVEERLLREAGAQLPAGYSIVPIDAQQVLIRNGGLHCLAGLVR